MKSFTVNVLQRIIFSFRYVLVFTICCLCFSCQENPDNSTSLPKVWTSYQEVNTIEEDFADMKAHGVGVVNIRANDIEQAKERLLLARQFGIKYSISLPEITENAKLIRELGFEPIDALMIGGVYKGKSIDRHLFQFKAGKNVIIIEPPVYNREFAYRLGGGHTGKPGSGEPIAHYFPDMPDPVKAEIVVPVSKFDGKQHLKILNAEISLAPEGTNLGNDDSVKPDFPASSEITNRKLYQLSFDLSGMDYAMLDHVGVAVYWPYHGSDKYWMFHQGNVSASAFSTHQAGQAAVQNELTKWKDANGGNFPSDVVIAARFGDECFYPTGHSQQKNSIAVNYPLWEYSEPSVQSFIKLAGDIEYPRTWGFPEIYGSQAYGWWMYNLHKQTADLVGVIRDEIAKVAPGLLLYRNTTRTGIFDVSNYFDGSGQELLTRNLDIVHLDPYPVTRNGYNQVIPRHMSYCAGLARRYNRLLIPWLQAHIYGGLDNISPEQLDRMAEEHWAQGIDGIVWLGYGFTFPNERPDSWERAAEFHRKLETALPPKPEAKLAVLRSYETMAIKSIWENDLIRNPVDWLLQQFLETWAVKLHRPYDVFEIPPQLNTAQKEELTQDLKKYKYIVSTVPMDNAWVINTEKIDQVVDPEEAEIWQKHFEKEIIKRGWDDSNVK